MRIYVGNKRECYKVITMPRATPPPGIGNHLSRIGSACCTYKEERGTTKPVREANAPALSRKANWIKHRPTGKRKA